jgi:phytoene dehydrogenase-like protein
MFLVDEAADAPPGQHVVSAYVQYAPYHQRGTTWDAERDRLADTAIRTIEQYAPGFAASIVARTVITPLDLERNYGLTGGHTRAPGSTVDRERWRRRRFSRR